MTNKLQQYFPMIRTREEVLNEIESKSRLKNLFYEWTEENQNEFLDFCTGVKGIKIMYDFMIKEILNPENTPERVNELLTLLLGQRVRIVDVLPNDGTRLADESTLLITDMVVQLEDGSIANLEIQKIGYYFPGERSACYSADLLLRQYKRVRGIKGKRFSYRDIKQVYTIVLFEKSPTEFQKFSNNYIHRFMQKSDTGVNINLLQEYLFIPLDIFKKNQQNENRSVKIENRLEAWLAFFCMDDPETIIDIIEKYPDFKEMYEQIYVICRDLDEVMGMFSKELQELDRNSVELMVDEMQKDLDKTREELEDGVEILHGDWKLPTGEYTELSENGESLHPHNKIYIFERGSQFDILREVKNSYMWVSPVPEKLRKNYNLVQKHAGFSGQMIRDVLIYKKGYQKKLYEREFIEHLKETIREMM